MRIAVTILLLLLSATISAASDRQLIVGKWTADSRAFWRLGTFSVGSNGRASWRYCRNVPFAVISARLERNKTTSPSGMSGTDEPGHLHDYHVVAIQLKRGPRCLASPEPFGEIVQFTIRSDTQCTAELDVFESRERFDQNSASGWGIWQACNQRTANPAVAPRSLRSLDAVR